MSHIHRTVVEHPRHASALLNLYGRIRKGIEVAADLGSPLQRFLLAIGLVVINDDRCLEVRNRIYAAVFTARWANENLPAQWRGPTAAVALVLLMVAIPFWYTQLLPRGYVDVLTSPTIDLQYATGAYTNFRSFPGHASAADSLYRNLLRERAQNATGEDEIRQISILARELPEAGRLPEELVAGYWDRRARDAMRDERRDDALLATLESLVLATPPRRQLAASLIADDYPLLMHSLRAEPGEQTVFDSENMILTRADGAKMSQWAYDTQSVVRNNDWSVTALEVTPLVRRVLVDVEGVVSRIGLTLNLSHTRLADLRIKVIAPSGRTVEIETGAERSASDEVIRVGSSQLSDLIGEPINGTWSLSVRDEALGVAGHLVGWNLKLNSQGVIEDLERGLNIPDPVERETENIWFSDDGRYVVARAMQSDSARIWDLAFAKPIRAIAVGENEKLVGLDAGARRLVTATQNSIHLWDTSSGDRMATLEVGPASQSARITGDGQHLFVQRRSDIETEMEIWSFDDAQRAATLTVAGTPALVAASHDGRRVAVADYDRAVRIWDTQDSELLAQISLDAQPSALELAAGGNALGVIHGGEGVSLWHVDRPTDPLFELLDTGRWQLSFSRSGSSVLAGDPRIGYQVYRTEDGSLFGPALGPSSGADASILAFSSDEQTVVTSDADGSLRFWRVPVAPAIVEAAVQQDGRGVWSPSGDGILALSPDAKTVAIGDRSGAVHILPADGGMEALAAASGQVSFVGHNDEVRLLRMSSDGKLVASAAADNTVRIWNTAAGDPRAFSTEIPGNAISHLEFSPDSTLLAVLNGTRAEIVTCISGDIVAGFELGESHGALAFAENNVIYVGSEGGTLRTIQRDGSGGWSMQTVWQGVSALRWLESSPRGDFLVVVDADNRASQFNLTDGQPGASTITLPAPISEVRFSPGGSRVIFRTTRWVHRAGSTDTGLHWLDSAYGPAALAGSRIVFGESPDARGSRALVPVAYAGFIRIAELRFGTADTAGLFGSRNELIAEWRDKLGRAPAD